MKVLLTGDAGFIGSNLVRHILRKRTQWEVTNLEIPAQAVTLGELDGVEKLRSWEGRV